MDKRGGNQLSLTKRRLLDLIVKHRNFSACPSGYSASGRTKTCYKWHSTPKQWIIAKHICISNHGDLVSLDSQPKFSDFRSIAIAKGLSVLFTSICLFQDNIELLHKFDTIGRLIQKMQIKNN